MGIVSGASQLYTAFAVYLMVGIPLMVILVVLVLISSAVALCNTDKWASADVCCNLMRSRRAARCTRSCSGSKHCCARLSNIHIGASVMTSLVLVLYFATLSAGCVEAAHNHADYEHDVSRSNNYYYHHRYHYGSTSCGVTAGFEITTIIFLISLVASTARSAYLLRQIEQSMPEVAVLPPGKMVTQSDELAPFVPHTTDNVDNEKSESTDVTVVLPTAV